MKTLREYIDILDEISRRDFLKGAGAAAVGAMGSGAAAQTDFSKNVRTPAQVDKEYKEALLQTALTLLIIAKNENWPIQNDVNKEINIYIRNQGGQRFASEMQQVYDKSASWLASIYRDPKVKERLLGQFKAQQNQILRDLRKLNEV